MPDSEEAAAAATKAKRDRVFLVVVDDSAEQAVALRYACLRARKGGDQANEGEKEAGEAEAAGPAAGDGAEALKDVQRGKNDRAFIARAGFQHGEEREEQQQQKDPRVGELEGGLGKQVHRASGTLTTDALGLLASFTTRSRRWPR